MTNSRFIIANITWNETGWRNIYVDPRAGHRYARENPGHESLNFKFDKKKLDNENHVFGYVQWIGPPQKLGNEALIFFYSKNLKTQRNEIVGVYGNVGILKPAVKTTWEGFESNTLISNIKADKDLSLLFPIPLNSDKYSSGARLVPQSGFTYTNPDLATRIITDEIEALKESGLRKEEYQKLARIYEFITGKKYDFNTNPEISDENEQQELETIDEIRSQNKQEIVKELQSLGPQNPEIIEIKGKSYKRDNKTITQLKILRDFKCQICGHSIQKKNGGYYIEAAHIKMKSENGPERPNNILILCPNHHKEFDFGKRNVIEHNNDIIVFDLNGHRHKISLSLS